MEELFFQNREYFSKMEEYFSRIEKYFLFGKNVIDMGDFE
jgi:hypothetical protein